MTSHTYGTAELQGDAPPASPKSYRLSKVAKIALALVACGGAGALIAHPVTRKATTNFRMDQTGKVWDGVAGVWRSGGAAPADSSGAPLEDQVQDLEARVAAIEKLLKKAKGGSGTSRGSVMMPGVLGAMARGHGARRQLRGGGGARGRGLGERRV